jgi:hypothetical protein
MRHLAALNILSFENYFTTYNQPQKSVAIYLLATLSTTTSRLAISTVFPSFRTLLVKASAKYTSLSTSGRLASKLASSVSMPTSIYPLATRTSYLHYPGSLAIIQALLLLELSMRSFLVVVLHLIGLGGLLLITHQTTIPVLKV